MTKTLFDDLGALIDASLNVTDIGKAPHHRAKKSWKRLCAAQDSVDWPLLVEQLADKMQSEWNGQPATGRENWRFDPQLKLSPKNRGEKKLEKLMVKDRKGWANQIPTCSGVYDGNHRKRSVDLAHMDGATAELIELKTTSDTPLFAAMEILIYGLLYRFYRMNQAALGSAMPILTQPTRVELKVLAPTAYYGRLDAPQSLEAWRCLRTIEDGLNEGLNRLARNGYDMAFSFEEIPSSVTSLQLDRCDRGDCDAIVEHRSAVRLRTPA